MSKIYISGKISGLNFELVKQRFGRVEYEVLNASGCKVVNPLKKGLPKWFPWIFHMIYDIILLLGCNAIYMQRNWKDSRGAKIEHRVAKRLRYTIIYQAPLLAEYWRKNEVRKKLESL